MLRILTSLVLFCTYVKTTPVQPMALPTPISASTALTYLSELTVAVPSNSPPYSRKQFKIWDIVSRNCDTRETVLIRDGTDVVTNSACRAVSGTWFSPYDNATWTLASDLDIDHVVPLKEAWISGARYWTAERREAFANDLTRPQLLAVTDNVNQSKGDKDVSKWLPPLASYHCTYVRAWVEVKHFYDLTIDATEKKTLESILNSC